jgi:hypothetical protein
MAGGLSPPSKPKSMLQSAFAAAFLDLTKQQLDCIGTTLNLKRLSFNKSCTMAITCIKQSLDTLCHDRQNDSLDAQK